VLSNEGQYRIPGTNFKADGYHQESNTILEYNGDFWHGNPKFYQASDINPRSGVTYGDLYNQTKLKEEIIMKNHKLISIWASEWLKAVATIHKFQKQWKRSHKL
jgi:hypothetical protein